MFRTSLSWASILLVGVCSIQAAGPGKIDSAFPEQYRAVLNRYCVTCHNDKLKTAGLALDKLDTDNVPAGAPVWGKVINKLRTASMPPAGMPRPDKVTYDSLAAYLETSIDREAALH